MEITGLDKLVLVDTSVWIEYFRKKDKVFQYVSKLMDRGSVCIAKLIVAELIQGAKTEKEVAVIKTLLEVFPVLQEQDDTWEKAGELAFHLRRKGRSIGLADCYLVTLTEQNGALLFSFDKHFEVIRKEKKIDLLYPLP